MKQYNPEGSMRSEVLTLSELERAWEEGRIVEGVVTLCDEKLRLHVDLGCAMGIIEAEEAVYCRRGEERKDIALITRVGKCVAAKILSIEMQNGVPLVRLSRRLAQKACMESYLTHLRAGDLLRARVTHMEPFGAFLDIGCGVSSLLSVDCISVSRISHPHDRLRVGQSIPVVVKSVQEESERIYVSLRELLGTWEENAAMFEVGQTVTGVIRSVESYGVFVELAPNLAGLAEVRADQAESLRQRIGCGVVVYIKSILLERMKIKLVLIDSENIPTPTTPLRFFIDPATTAHIRHWRYSPALCHKLVESRFE